MKSVWVCHPCGVVYAGCDPFEEKTIGGWGLRRCVRCGVIKERNEMYLVVKPSERGIATVYQMRAALASVDGSLEIVVRAFDDDDGNDYGNDYVGGISSAEVQYAHDDDNTPYFVIDCGPDEVRSEPDLEPIHVVIPRVPGDDDPDDEPAAQRPKIDDEQLGQRLWEFAQDEMAAAGWPLSRTDAIRLGGRARELCAELLWSSKKGGAS